MSEGDDVRHGVFLLPDDRTGAAVTAITNRLRERLGFVSAGRFPPHVTVAGSLPLAVPEPALVDAVQGLAARHPRFRVTNAGPRRLWGSVLAFDVHDDGHGRPNQALVDLAADLVDVVGPMLRPTTHLPADVRGPEDWHGHLSLASHELRGRPDLLDAAEQVVAELDEPYPARFTAVRLAVVRLHHPDWAGDWWTGFRWETVRVLLLAEGA